MNKKFKLASTCGLLLLSLCGLGGCANHHSTSANNNPTTSQVSQNNNQKNNQQNNNIPANTQNNSQNAQIQKLAASNYASGTDPVVQINNGKSTLDAASWQTNKVIYSKLDSLNRTSSPATAFLESRNVANDSLRTTQTVQPTGWHQKFDSHHNAILNRGHIIAYSLSKGIDLNGQFNPNNQSGDQNNMRNLFTQTAFCNQQLQTIYETKVRDALRQGEKVIYQVQPIFEGNDLMAKGVWMQAVSTNGNLNFNVFIWNVQPSYKFNYQDGTSVVDPAMRVPLPAGAKMMHYNNSNNNENQYYNHHNHNEYNEYHHHLTHHLMHHHENQNEY